MRRRFASCALAAGLIAASSVAIVGAAPAAATPVTTGASAYSAAASTGSATLAANLNLGGAVGNLLNWAIAPIVNGALNPLVSALQATVNSAVSGLLGSASSLSVATPSQQASTAPGGSFPLTDAFPSPCTSSSATQPCYAATSIGVNAGPLTVVSVPALKGYAEQVASSADPTNPTIGRAQVANPSVSVLPGIPSLLNPLVSTGVIDAKANCPNNGASASAAVSATSVVALGGLVKLNVLNGQITGLVVNGVNIGSLASLPLTTLPGAIVVQSFGTALRIDIPLSLDQLLAGLGLGSLGSVLDPIITSAGLKLSLVLGPSTTVTPTSAKAWGLGIGVDLSGSLSFNLLGLVTAALTIPTGIGGGNFGNLLDARLGYAACQAGSNTTSGGGPAVVPPALI